MSLREEAKAELIKEAQAHVKDRLKTLIARVDGFHVAVKYAQEALDSFDEKKEIEDYLYRRFNAPEYSSISSNFRVTGTGDKVSW